MPSGPWLAKCYLRSSLLRPHVPALSPLSYFAFTLVAESLQLGPPAAGRQRLPDVALRVCHWMLGPLPRLSQQCSRPFLPAERRSSPTVERVDTSQLSHATTSAWNRISGLQSFLNVQASSSACHPGRSYRRDLPLHVAAVAFPFEHRMSCYLLTRRIC